MMLKFTSKKREKVQKILWTKKVYKNRYLQLYLMRCYGKVAQMHLYKKNWRKNKAFSWLINFPHCINIIIFI